MSAPNSVSLARRPALVEVPITRPAPMNFAICSPIRPTPELAPWITTLWPFLSWPLVTTASCMVCRPTGSVAAVSKDMLLSGMRTVRPRSLTAYSA